MDRVRIARLHLSAHRSSFFAKRESPTLSLISLTTFVISCVGAHVSNRDQIFIVTEHAGYYASCQFTIAMSVLRCVHIMKLCKKEFQDVLNHEATY